MHCSPLFSLKYFLSFVPTPLDDHMTTPVLLLLLLLG